MENTKGNTREAFGKVTPILLKKNWEKNREEVLRYLKHRGIFITKEGLIHKTQLRKCIELLSEHTRYQMMGLEDFASIIE